MSRVPPGWAIQPQVVRKPKVATGPPHPLLGNPVCKLAALLSHPDHDHILRIRWPFLLLKNQNDSTEFR